MLSLIGMGRLLGGDLEGGRRDIERVADLWPQDVGLFRSDRDRAFGWLAAEQGDLPRARELMSAGAANAAARGAHALEAMLLHDVVRFGGALTVAERLVDLGGRLQGELIAARAAHAVGIVEADTDELTGVVAAFEHMGSPLLAAEAAVDLAVACRSHGDRAAAAAALTDARRLRAMLDGPVVTVALADLDANGDAVTSER